MVRLNHGPDPQTGKRRQTWDSERFKTEKEAERRLALLLHHANRGPRIDPTRRPVRDLIVEWLEQETQAGVQAGTLEDYESICRVHLIPAFGQIVASQLTSGQVERWRTTYLATGHSPSVVARCTLHLGQAFKYGVRHNYLTHNPVAALKPIRHEHREMEVWTAKQVVQFLAVANGHSYHPVWALALYTGMRKGELVGLRWDDIDFESGVLRVRRSLGWANGALQIDDTKNRQARTIDMPRELIAILREHRTRQPERRLGAVARYVDQGYVCASAVGTPLNPYNITRAYHPLQEQAGVPRIRFHDLRHTCASLLLAAGVPVHVVSRQLGHASAAVTMRVYAHLMAGQGREAAEVMSRLLAPTAPPTAPRTT